MEFSKLLESQLPPTLPRLTLIEFIGVSSTDGEIAKVLRWSTAGWRSIIIRANHPMMTPRFWKESFKEVLKHAVTLDVLRVEGAWWKANRSRSYSAGCPNSRLYLVPAATTYRRILGWRQVISWRQSGHALTWRSLTVRSKYCDGQPSLLTDVQVDPSRPKRNRIASTSNGGCVHNSASLQI